MPLRDIISNKVFDVAMDAVKWGSVLICAGLVLVLIAIAIRLYGPE